MHIITNSCIRVAFVILSNVKSSVKGVSLFLLGETFTVKNAPSLLLYFYWYRTVLGLHLHFSCLPIIHSHLQWVRCGGKVIFTRIIIHASVSPLILPRDPNPSLSTPVLSSFPYTFKCASESRCSDNCFGTTVFHPNPQTCCHGNWALQNGTIERPSHETWMMNLSFCVCVCVCEGTNRQIPAVNHFFCHFITEGKKKWSKKKKKKTTCWIETGR